MKSGLVSVTFRKLTAREIITLVAQAGLDGIEWGGDVHVPHGQIETAREVARATSEAGLGVAAYGSYYRCAESEPQGLAFDTVLDTAAALGAPTVRVWTGKSGSRDADPDYRRRIVDDLTRIASLSEQRGMTVSCEYHSGTLTDTDESAQKLMREVGHPNLRLYWQPPLGQSPEYNVSGLQAILPVLTHLHVFHWVLAGEARDQRPLAEGADVWARYFEQVRFSKREHWALIEFVRGESTQQFLDDAAALKTWVTDVSHKRS